MARTRSDGNQVLAYIYSDLNRMYLYLRPVMHVDGNMFRQALWSSYKTELFLWR